MPEIDIRQQVMERGYWIAIPSDVLRRIVEVLVEQADGEVGEYAAVADLLLHADRGITRSEREWAKRWRWSAATVHRFLKKQRSKSEAEMKQKRSKSEAESGEFLEESPKAEAGMKQKRSKSEAKVKQPIYIDRASSEQEQEEEEEREEEERSDVRAGAKRSVIAEGYINPNDPQARPPTETEVRDWARSMGGVPPDTAWEIAESYMATGWVTNKGGVIRDWKSAIRTAYTYRKSTGWGKHGTHRGINQKAGADDAIGGSPTGEALHDKVAAELRRRTGGGDGAKPSGAATPELTR